MAKLSLENLKSNLRKYRNKRAIEKEFQTKVKIKAQEAERIAYSKQSIIEAKRKGRLKAKGRRKGKGGKLSSLRGISSGLIADTVASLV